MVLCRVMSKNGKDKTVELSLKKSCVEGILFYFLFYSFILLFFFYFFYLFIYLFLIFNFFFLGEKWKKVKFQDVEEGQQYYAFVQSIHSFGLFVILEHSKQVIFFCFRFFLIFFSFLNHNLFNFLSLFFIFFLFLFLFSP